MQSQFKYIRRQDNKITLSISGGWSTTLRNELRRREFDYLSINSGDWADFAFLEEFAPGIERLLVLTNAASYRGLGCLTNLKELLLDGVGSAPFDIDKLRKLKSAKLYWSEHYAGKLFRLPDLTELSLTKFGDTDCRQLSVASSLTSLELIQGNVEDLSGLEALHALRKLHLVSVARLSRLGAISELPLLSDVRVSGAKRLEDISELFRARAIRTLWIEKTSVQSSDLAWLDRLPTIESVVFGIPVGSPDWPSVFGHPTLRRISFAYDPSVKLDAQRLRASAAEFNKRVVKAAKGKLSGLPALVLEIEPQLSRAAI